MPSNGIFSSPTAWTTAWSDPSPGWPSSGLIHPSPPHTPPPQPSGQPSGHIVYIDDIPTTITDNYDLPDSPPLVGSPVTHQAQLYGNYISKNRKDPMEDKDKEKFYNRKVSGIVGFRNGKQKGEVGIEIECEGTNLARNLLSYWDCHEDRSLRDYKGHSPNEYVLKEPLPRKEIRPALEYLDTKLKENGSFIVKSNRTSVHVHTNCQQMTVRELYCFICLYLIFEELLVEWSGPERIGNLFCLRGKDSEYWVGLLEKALKENSLAGWRDDYRYSACNIASICKFGSLEFRSLQGTVDVETIMCWVELILHIKDQAEKFDNPVEIVEQFQAMGALPFFRKIFLNTKYLKMFESSPNLSSKIWDGLRLMRDIAYSCPWDPPNKKKLPVKKSPAQRRKTSKVTLDYLPEHS